MIADPRQFLSDSAMTTVQVVAIALAVALVAVDGFDVLSISFASPGIAQEWGIGRAALGIVLSMELVGMSVGAIVLGDVADRIGRRRALLACLFIITLGMAAVPTSSSVYQLCAWRLLTGVGIGGMLAVTNAVTAEFSNARRKDLCIALMVVGYPIGAVTGGMIASHLLVHGDWRQVFIFGASVSALLVPAVLWGIPESVVWLCEKQPSRALERTNRSLLRLGYHPIAALPAPAGRASKAPVVDLFAPARRLQTALVTAVYFLHMTTFYFVLKWIPKIVVDMGFAASAAAGVLVWANVGGAAGGVIFGVLTRRFALRQLTVAFFVASTAAVVIFGRGQGELAGLSLLCAFTGFFVNGGVVGAYALIAHAFPAHLRASGTGFAIGIGRTGAALAPIIAGFLFQAGLGLQFVAIAMGAGSLLAAACVLALPRRLAATPAS